MTCADAAYENSANAQSALLLQDAVSSAYKSLSVPQGGQQFPAQSVESAKSRTDSWNTHCCLAGCHSGAADSWLAVPGGSEGLLRGPGPSPAGWSLASPGFRGYDHAAGHRASRSCRLGGRPRLCPAPSTRGHPPAKVHSTPACQPPVIDAGGCSSCATSIAGS